MHFSCLDQLKIIAFTVATGPVPAITRLVTTPFVDHYWLLSGTHPPFRDELKLQHFCGESFQQPQIPFVM